MCVALAVLLAGCSGGSGGHSGKSADASAASSGPRALTSSEAERLAVIRFNAYRAKTRSVQATIVSGTGTVTLRGWINTVKGEGYALVTPKGQGAEPFLTLWNAKEVSAESYSGRTAPLPPPKGGWQSIELSANASALAAAQLLVLGLSADRPDNPQLLIQGKARWLRGDTLAGKKVDVMTGPLATGATVSNLRYWVDHQGRLLRLEANLDQGQWSVFDFADTPKVTF